jgi:uncharacterized protein YciI
MAPPDSANRAVVQVSVGLSPWPGRRARLGVMFVVELMFGINRDERLSVRPAHREYLAELAVAGKLVVAGPWANDTGAMLILDVADRAELDQILDADPYTPAKVIAEVRIREWSPITGSWLG